MPFNKKIILGWTAFVMTTLTYGQNNTAWSTTANIGIGTISPGTYKLNIQGSPTGDVYIGGSQGATITLGNSSWPHLMGIDSSNIFYLKTNNTRYFTASWDASLMSFGPSQAITINNGNVGIGLSSPIYKLDIKGSGVRVTDAGGNAAGLDLVESSGGHDWAILSWGSAAGGGTIPGSFSIYDNTAGAGHRLFIDGSGNVGIGTTSPAYKLDIKGPGARVTDTGGNAAGLDLVESSGGHDWAILSWGNVAGGGTIPGCFSIYDNTSGGHRLFIDSLGNVGIGTTSPSAKLSVNGTIHAKEIIVDTAGWSDYVFSSNYKLKPLSEVERQIKSAGHLPDMPSAAEVAEKGINLSDMQARLLSKIEELTLHQIDQEKRLGMQSQRIDELTQENKALHDEIVEIRTQ